MIKGEEGQAVGSPGLGTRWAVREPRGQTAAAEGMAAGEAGTGERRSWGECLDPFPTPLPPSIFLPSAPPGRGEKQWDLLAS